MGLISVNNNTLFFNGNTAKRTHINLFSLKKLSCGVFFTPQHTFFGLSHAIGRSPLSRRAVSACLHINLLCNSDRPYSTLVKIMSCLNTSNYNYYNFFSSFHFHQIKVFSTNKDKSAYAGTADETEKKIKSSVSSHKQYKEGLASSQFDSPQAPKKDNSSKNTANTKNLKPFSDFKKEKTPSREVLSQSLLAVDISNNNDVKAKRGGSAERDFNSKSNRGAVPRYSFVDNVGPRASKHVKFYERNVKSNFSSEVLPEDSRVNSKSILSKDSDGKLPVETAQANKSGNNVKISTSEKIIKGSSSGRSVGAKNNRKGLSKTGSLASKKSALSTPGDNKTASTTVEKRRYNPFIDNPELFDRAMKTLSEFPENGRSLYDDSDLVERFQKAYEKKRIERGIVTKEAREEDDNKFSTAILHQLLADTWEKKPTTAVQIKSGQTVNNPDLLGAQGNLNKRSIDSLNKESALESKHNYSLANAAKEQSLKPSDSALKRLASIAPGTRLRASDKQQNLLHKDVSSGLIKRTVNKKKIPADGASQPLKASPIASDLMTRQKEKKKKVLQKKKNEKNSLRLLPSQSQLSRKRLRRAAYKRKKEENKKKTPGYLSIFHPLKWRKLSSFDLGPALPKWFISKDIFSRLHNRNKWSSSKPSVLPVRRYFLTRLNYTSRFSMAQHVAVQKAYSAATKLFYEYRKRFYRAAYKRISFLNRKKGHYFKKYLVSVHDAKRAVVPKKKKKVFSKKFFLTIDLILGKKKKSKKYNTASTIIGSNETERYFDTGFAKDFIDNKKRRFRILRFDPVTKVTTDIEPKKFFFYNLKKDPVYNSFLLEKVISSFSKHGEKEKIRKIFYNIFISKKSIYNIGTLYYIIDSLRPKYINVPVRAGPRYYYAPILASPFRSALRAIRFFKMAVMSHKDKKSLEEKILFELENIFEFLGYVNPYYHDYVTMSENNKYLAHFRKRRII